jgi:radical SAM protein with 4Fe4S-binding SPASM domain
MTTEPGHFRSKKSVAQVLAAFTKDKHTPISAMIEIADRCNEVCIHCYQIQGQKGEMSTDEVKSVMDQLAELGVLMLTISGGEPTLRHDFIELVEHARRKKFAVKIFTNGLTMTRELAGKLAALAVQEVQISVYSHRAEVHDEVTGVRGSWERTVAAVRNLRDARVAVVVKTPMMKLNAGESDAYIDFAIGLGADYMMDPHMDPREDGDRAPETLRVDPETYARAHFDPRLGGKTRKEEMPGPKDLNASVCGACSGNVHIEANGELRPCTQLTVPVGHAVRDGVKAAWERNEDGAAIRSLTWQDLHGCRDCALNRYCGRCYANAMTEGGDALGPYLSACARARLHYEMRHGHALELLPPASDDRVSGLGPFVETAPGVFAHGEDVVTQADLEKRRRHAWIRQAPSPAGDLVQLRRPGARKKPALAAGGRG